jgi:hypothetical protein
MPARSLLILVARVVVPVREVSYIFRNGIRLRQLFCGALWIR